jgi:hypothetical protein
LGRLFVSEFERLLESGVGLCVPCSCRPRGSRLPGGQETGGASNPSVVDTLVAASAVLM